MENFRSQETQNTQSRIEKSYSAVVNALKEKIHLLAIGAIALGAVACNDHNLSEEGIDHDAAGIDAEISSDANFDAAEFADAGEPPMSCEELTDCYSDAFSKDEIAACGLDYCQSYCDYTGAESKPCVADCMEAGYQTTDEICCAADELCDTPWITNPTTPEKVQACRELWAVDPSCY